MDKKTKTIFAIIVFYIIAVAVRYLATKTEILLDVNMYVKIICEGIGPTLGVIIALLIFRMKFSPMTLKGNYSSFLFPALTYWLVPILLISSYSAYTQGKFPVFYVFMIFVYGILEEIGWRGFLQQQLKELPKWLSILIITVLWFVWHLNFSFSVSALFFFGILLFGSWGIGVVANSTNSLLAVSAFHSLNNINPEKNYPIVIVLFIVWIAIVSIIGKKKKKYIKSV
jgi:membrane protease YdiL (CAAX protease family)